MREIQADIPIMIHLDNGGFNEMYVEWFDEFTKRAEPFDTARWKIIVIARVKRWIS